MMVSFMFQLIFWGQSKLAVLDMVSTLAHQTGKFIDQQVPDAWRWRRRSVRIIDGTTVTLPDTAENQAVFPQQRSQKPGLGFPICRIVGITCLSSGAVLTDVTPLPP